MQIGLKFIVAISSVFIGSVEASVEENLSYVLCKNNKVVRTIRINSDEGGGCKTVYTKLGVDRVVGKARSQTSCEGFLNNIKGNLEEAAWQCRVLSQSKTTLLNGPIESKE